MSFVYRESNVDYSRTLQDAGYLRFILRGENNLNSSL